MLVSVPQSLLSRVHHRISASVVRVQSVRMGKMLMLLLLLLLLLLTYMMMLMCRRPKVIGMT